MRRALALNDQAVCLLEAGELTASARLLDEALRLCRDAPDILFNRGLVFERMGDVGKARKMYDQALVADDNHVKALVHLGNLAAQEGKTEDAERCYQRALEASETFVPAHYNYGVLLERQGSEEDALEAYRWAVALDPGFCHAWLGVARVAGALSREADAAEALAKAFAAAESPDDLAKLGATAARLERLDIARRALQAALEVDPAHLESRYHLAVVLWFSGSSRDALQEVRSASRLATLGRRSDVAARCRRLEQEMRADLDLP